jgi:phospholipid/cholesterol/gamma-HCH transport system ATP-binding protein
MEDTEDLMPAELSGGMKKRVGIARAIAIKPAYLFYDEPTTGLDPVMTDSINRLIRKFQDTGNVTSVIVTHEMRTVYDVADRIILLHEGNIQYDGSPDTIDNVDDPVVQQFITGNSTLA